MQTCEGAYREKQDTLFTMHDLVHDLAVLLLGDEIMDQSKQGNTLSSSCRYALLTDSSKPLELCLSSCARLTALRFIDCRRTELCCAAFAPANFLRVLDLRECHIQKLPESIGQLQQLSYLKAPEIQDQLIPDCITQLSKLNYLDISGSEISALPESSRYIILFRNRTITIVLQEFGKFGASGFFTLFTYHWCIRITGKPQATATFGPEILHKYWRRAARSNGQPHRIAIFELIIQLIPSSS
jgi:Leucine-rich repeat (LRR) protein